VTRHYTGEAGNFRGHFCIHSPTTTGGTQHIHESIFEEKDKSVEFD